MTIMFMGNGCRLYSPWDGREHILSLQYTRGYLWTGATRSRNLNPISEHGQLTIFEFARDRTTYINYVQGVVRATARFGRVVAARFAPGSVTLIEEADEGFEIAICHEFLCGAELEAAAEDLRDDS